MNINKGEDNNFLAKWLNAEISDNALAKLVAKSDLESYKKIKDSLDLFEAPSFNKEKIYNTIKSRIQKPKPKLIQLIPTWAYSAAASVVLLLAAYLFFFSETNLSTGYGQQTAFNLQDGTFIKLNAKSVIRFNKRTWREKRIVKLNGEAYFEVSKGVPFIVKTDFGEIQVLGTHFDVKTGKNYLKIVCFEGKIAVTHNNKKTILSQGTSLQIMGNELIKEVIANTNPSWLSGINTYKNTPLYIIIKDLESEFHITIDTKNIDLNRQLTASFTYNNVNLALESIFIPLNLDFTLKNNIVRLSKK